MMEQEQVVQEKKDDAVSEAKPEEEKVDEKSTSIPTEGITSFLRKLFQKENVAHRVIFFLIVGILFEFAPTYIQTSNQWVIIISTIIAIACILTSLIHFVETSTFSNKKPEIRIVMGFVGAFLLYYLSYFQNSGPSDPDRRIGFKVLSFLSLLISVLYLVLRFPQYIRFYRQNKDKIKAFFNAKRTAAVILGIVSVGTALFQLIQLVMQIFHL